MNKLIRMIIMVVLLGAGVVTMHVRSVQADPNTPPPMTYVSAYVAPTYPEMRPQASAAPSVRFETTAAPITDTTILITDPIIDMKVLVIHGMGSVDGLGLEHPYNMVKSNLDILGIPYDTVNLNASETISETDLWDGINHGYYYAIFLTTSGDWTALSAETREVITAYERNFGVRQVTWYSIPIPSYNGLDYYGSGIQGPVTLTLTTAGQSVFSYLRPDVEIGMGISTTFGYTATIAPGADVTPLLVDSEGGIAMAIFRPGDGREHLAFTWSSYYRAIPPTHLHARLLPYGVINWATKGVFVGERHVYFAPQPDDIFSYGNRWDIDNDIILNGNEYRLSAGDLDNVIAWMNDLRANEANAGDFMIEMPFNGEGTQYDREGGVLTGDIISGTLTDRAVELQGQFVWLNHTYTHANLNTADYDLAHVEILSNTEEASKLGFTHYTTATLLTGDYSGITNTTVISVAYELGVRYILANASYPAYRNPTPNTGIPHPDKPEILLVPRHANNIFYFSVTPEEETDYYNFVYTSTVLTYDQIIDKTTDQSLENLLDFNINATMFHMNNLIAYNAPTQTNTILSDFVESLYGKYNTYYNTNAPILSLRTQEIGEKMWERMAYDASGVSAVWTCGDSITLTVTDTARIPITGINSALAVYTETYAGQDISYFDMNANDTLFIAGAAASVPEQISGLSVVVSDTNVLAWNAVATDTNGAAVQALFYRVYRDGTLIADRVATTTYTDASPVAGGTYTVTAIGDNCWKRESEGASATPTTPLTFSTSTLAETVTVTWTTQVETNTLGFNLYRADAVDGPWTTTVNTEVISPKGGGVYTVSDTGAEGERIYYRLEEVETAATGSATLWYTPFYVDIGVASTPYRITGLTVNVASAQHALTWNPTVSNTTGAALGALVYRVYRSTDAEFTPSISTLVTETTTTAYTDTDALAGVTYIITAIGDNEWQRESIPARATPTTMLNFSTSVLAGTVMMSWTTQVETHTYGFNLYISTPATPTWTQVNTEIVIGKGSGVYTFVDPNDRRNGTFSYRLEEVENESTGSARLWYEPVSIDIGPNAVSLAGLQAQAPLGALFVPLGTVVLLLDSRIRTRKRRIR